MWSSTLRRAPSPAQLTKQAWPQAEASAPKGLLAMPGQFAGTVKRGVVVGVGAERTSNELKDKISGHLKPGDSSGGTVCMRLFLRHGRQRQTLDRKGHMKGRRRRARRSWEGRR